MKKTAEKTANWSGLKRHLSGFDRAALLGLIQDLYAASKDNQAFLHARFALGGDVLEPYKKTIAGGVSPEHWPTQAIKPGKAKKAISDYKKAIGRPEDLAELCVFYCESCIRMLANCAIDEAGFYDALADVFEQALKATATLEPERQEHFVERLNRVRSESQSWGWGIGSELNQLMAEHGFDRK